MDYRIEVIPYFRKRTKRLIKKFPFSKQELAELGKQLAVDPKRGTPIGKHCYTTAIRTIF